MADGFRPDCRLARQPSRLISVTSGQVDQRTSGPADQRHRVATPQSGRWPERPLFSISIVQRIWLAGFSSHALNGGCCNARTPPSACLAVCLPACCRPSVCLPGCLSAVCPSVRPSVCLSVCWLSVGFSGESLQGKGGAAHKCSLFHPRCEDCRRRRSSAGAVAAALCVISPLAGG